MQVEVETMLLTLGVDSQLVNVQVDIQTLFIYLYISVRQGCLIVGMSAGLVIKRL